MARQTSSLGLQAPEEIVMADDDIKVQLTALRAEVAALAAARKQAAPKQPEEKLGPAAQADTKHAPPHEGFMGDVQELIEVLEKEMRETPMVTGLAVFSLGVLFGRFLR